MVDVIMVASYSAVFLFYTNFPYIKLYLPESIQLFRRKNMNCHGIPIFLETVKNIGFIIFYPDS